jgi:hypothetical protein
MVIYRRRKLYEPGQAIIKLTMILIVILLQTYDG